MIDILIKIVSLATIAVGLLTTLVMTIPKTEVEILLGAISVGLPEVVEGANPTIREEKDWNSTTKIKRDGSRTIGISSKQRNYLDNGVWKPIDTKLVQTADGFEMTEAPFYFIAPLRSTGIATFRNDNEYDISTKKIINEISLNKQITAVGVNDVAGQLVRGDLMAMNGLHKNAEYVLYAGAYNDADLIYYVDFGAEPRLAQLIRWNIKPTCTLPLTRTFIWQYSDDVEISSLDSQSKEVKWSKNGTLDLSSNLPANSLDVQKVNSDRGIGHYPFQIWDSVDFMETLRMNRNIRQINATLIKTGTNRYTFTKIIPCDFFTSAVYPVYTDETFKPAVGQASPVDGQTHAAGVTSRSWNSIRNTNGTGALPLGTTMRTGLTGTLTANEYDTNVRSVILFDTSTLADDFVVGSATIDLIGDAKSQVTGDADSYRISSSTPASNSDVVAGDYSTTNVSNVGFTNFANADVAYADVNTDGVAEQWTLNATGRDAITVTGISKFGVVGVFDATATEPNSTTEGLNRVNWRTADYTPAGSEPLLTVNVAAGGEDEGGVIKFIYWKLYDFKIFVYYKVLNPLVNTAYAH